MATNPYMREITATPMNSHRELCRCDLDKLVCAAARVTLLGEPVHMQPDTSENSIIINESPEPNQVLSKSAPEVSRIFECPIQSLSIARANDRAKQAMDALKVSNRRMPRLGTKSSELFEQKVSVYNQVRRDGVKYILDTVNAVVVLFLLEDIAHPIQVTGAQTTILVHRERLAQAKQTLSDYGAVPCD